MIQKVSIEVLCTLLFTSNLEAFLHTIGPEVAERFIVFRVLECIFIDRWEAVFEITIVNERTFKS